MFSKEISTTLVKHSSTISVKDNQSCTIIVVNGSDPQAIPKTLEFKNILDYE